MHGKYVIGEVSLHGINHCPQYIRSLSKDTAETRRAMETVIAGIEVAEQALVFYDQFVEQVIPWKDFSETFWKLDKFKNDYSAESAALIGEIKTFMMNGMDAYFAASQDVYEFAGTLTTHLKLYIKLFDGHNARKADAQKNLMLELFDSGLKKLKSAQEQLGDSSQSFNTVFGQLSTLRKRFEDEFDMKSEFFKIKMKYYKKGARFFGSLFGLSGYFLGVEIGNRKYVHKLQRELHKIKMFYYYLHVQMAAAFNNIDDTKRTLLKEIQHISDLKIQIDQTQTLVDLDYVADLREQAIDAANHLITKCMAYRKRHILL